MASLLSELRQVWRRLLRAPGFTLTGLLTLALTIGGCTAIFSVVDGVLLKPLGYRDGERLVVIWEKVPYLVKIAPYIGPNARHAGIWEEHARSFSDLSLLEEYTGGVSLKGDHPTYVGRLIVQPNLLNTLGVQPILGRDFRSDDAIAGHQNVAILSWDLWQKLFQGDPGVLGKTVIIADVPRQVIGVLPKSFSFPRANELSPKPEAQDTPDVGILSPLVIDTSRGYGWNSDYGNFNVIGRLKPGVTVAQAESELNLLAKDIMRQMPAGDVGDGPRQDIGAFVQPLQEAIVGRTAHSLWLLLAAVLSVLLIGCVNLSNAQLARYLVREREAAVRSALGASAQDLVRAFLTEVLLLCLAGGVLGVALAQLAVHALVAYTRIALPRTGNISLHPAVLGLSLLLTLGATVILGLLPALRLIRTRPQHALQESARAGGSRRGNLLRRGLIGAQIFACTTLLLVTGLFAKSLLHLLRSDKGFASDHLVVAEVNMQGKQFTDASRVAFADGVLGKLHELPGVQSASLVNRMLLAGETWINRVQRPDQPNLPMILANFRWVSPEYFASLRQPLLEGRLFGAQDRNLKTAIVSRATAEAVWPHEYPIGRQLIRNDTTYTVVGIVADAHDTSLRTAPVNMVYMPYWDDPPYGDFFLVRSTQDPGTLTDAVRQTIWAQNSSVTIANVRTMDAQVADSLAPERMETTLLAFFGGAALLLSLLGIYSTLSYSVQSRTREIGVRMALGASRSDVCRNVSGQVVLPLIVGLLLGWATSLAVARTVKSLLSGVSAEGAGLTVSIMLTFCIVAALATLLPALRAAQVEPTQALRQE